LAKKRIKLKRLSLSLTVPGTVSEEIWNHILTSIEEYEKSNSVRILDLDIKSVPLAVSPR
jgi:hypothetical protein